MDERLALLVKRLRRGRLLPSGTGRDVDVAPARLLPHRAPMLLLDRVTGVDPETGRIRATRRIDPADPVFAGHFPDHAVYPGVLLVEAMAQAALAALPFVAAGDAELAADVRPPAVRFTRVRDAAFFAPVSPGDTIEVHAEATDEGLVVSALGQVFRGDVLCAYAISEAQIHDGEP